MRPATFYNPPSMAYEPDRHVPKPSAIEAIIGDKLIGEMTPDEYLRIAAEAQIALDPRPLWTKKIG
jgi:hypothetical protein